MARKERTTGLNKNSKHEHAVLVEVQRAVAGLVAFAAYVVQARQERGELVEILQARHVLFAYVLALLAGHAAIMRAARNRAIPPMGD